ncbi:MULTISPECIES: Na+/H+ antiporter subunit E [Actinomycetes]|uniref:Multicomponent Na+:H+ antiporter subunit E n=2 Tax=Actinomycetes TaxID=1760 RepID=A0ABP6M5S2_9MICC
MIVRWVSAALLRGLVVGLLWTGLTQAAPEKLVYGAVAVVVGVGVSLWLLPPRPAVAGGGLPRRAAAVMRLGAWFFRQMVVGGVDVSLRALGPRSAVRPAVVRAPLRLPPGARREIALLLMNLMPGALVQAVITGEDEDREGSGHHHGWVEIHTVAESLRPEELWDRLVELTGALHR